MDYRCTRCQEAFGPNGVRFRVERDIYGTGDSPGSATPVSPCCGEEVVEPSGDYADPDSLPEFEPDLIW